MEPDGRRCGGRADVADHLRNGSLREKEQPSYLLSPSDRDGMGRRSPRVVPSRDGISFGVESVIFAGVRSG